MRSPPLLQPINGLSSKVTTLSKLIFEEILSHCLNWLVLVPSDRIICLKPLSGRGFRRFKAKLSKSRHQKGFMAFSKPHFAAVCSTEIFTDGAQRATSLN
ncbi:MAG: hypothetical protein ACK5EU_02900, partial [Pseudanabaena sp.]